MSLLRKLSHEDLLKKSLVVLCSLNAARGKLAVLPSLLNWNKLSAVLIVKLKKQQKEADSVILKYKCVWMKKLCAVLFEPKFVVAFKSFINLAYNRDTMAVEELLKMLESVRYKQ